MNVEVSYTSYQLANMKWVAQIKERKFFPNEIKEQTYAWNEQFDTKKEADDFAKTKVNEANSEV